MPLGFPASSAPLHHRPGKCEEGTIIVPIMLTKPTMCITPKITWYCGKKVALLLSLFNILLLHFYFMWNWLHNFGLIWDVSPALPPLKFPAMVHIYSWLFYATYHVLCHDFLLTATRVESSDSQGETPQDPKVLLNHQWWDYAQWIFCKGQVYFHMIRVLAAHTDIAECDVGWLTVNQNSPSKCGYASFAIESNKVKLVSELIKYFHYHDNWRLSGWKKYTLR